MASVRFNHTTRKEENADDKSLDLLCLPHSHQYSERLPQRPGTWTVSLAGPSGLFWGKLCLIFYQPQGPVWSIGWCRMGGSLQMIGQVKTILSWEVTHHSENRSMFLGHWQHATKARKTSHLGSGMGAGPGEEARDERCSSTGSGWNTGPQGGRSVT